MTANFNAFKSNATILDDITNATNDTATAQDFFHLSGGIDWELSWANLILGVAYASSSASIEKCFN